jgi:recombination protein RecT
MAALADVATNKLTPERIAKMVLMASTRQPELLNCTMESILKAAMTSADLGLDCSGVLGRAYLVPYGREATFITGYLGYIELAYRSGQIESIQAEVVYKQDYFKYEKGLTNTLEHIPNDDHDELDADIIGAYVIAKFRPSGHNIVWMKRKKIEKVRDEYAKTKKVWNAHFAEMCKKTVCRAAQKYWPLSVEIQVAIAAAEQAEFGEAMMPQVLTLQPTQGREKWGFPKQEEEPTEPPPPVEEPGEPQPGLNLGGEPEFYKDVQRMFFARCGGKKYTEGQREEARVAFFGFLMIEDWPEIQTETKAAEAKDWINKMLKTGKK